jgi:nucleoid DNA-binding protein
LPLTQTQLATAVADRAEITSAEAKRILGALEEIVLEELDNAQKVRVGGLVQLTVRVKPAQKKRICRNRHMRLYVALRTMLRWGGEACGSPAVGC